MKRRAQAAVTNARSLISLWSDGAKIKAREIVYEVWCFMPPSERLLGALAATRASGEQVTLVTPDQFAERVRATVLAAVGKDDENAFVQASTMIMKAFGLKQE